MGSIEIVDMAKIGFSHTLRIGQELNALVCNDEDVRNFLHQRNFDGVIQRHFDLDSSVENAKKARRLALSNELGAYALLDTETNLAVGMATVYPNLGLWRQKLPLPPLFTRNLILGTRIRGTGEPTTTENGSANVSAWVGIDKDVEDNLERAYSFLITKAKNTWTTEPLESPGYVHDAIVNAGLYPDDVRPGYYDDYESRKAIPAISKLYAHRSVIKPLDIAS